MMNSYSIGDLSRSFQLRLDQNNLKERMDVLSKELSSGLKSDIPQALGGNLSGISHIASRMTLLNSFQLNASEVSGYLEGMQTALGSVQTSVQALGTSLMTEASTSSDLELRSRTDSAKETFRSVWNTVNTSVAGRFLFAGSNTDTAPLGDFDSMMTSLTTAVSGALTINDITSRIDDWFDAPAGGGGFADQYHGNDAPGVDAPISPNAKVDSDLNANSPELRNALKGLAMMAFASEQGTAIATPTLRSIFSTAGELLVQSGGDLTGARADIGVKEKSVKDSASANADELSRLTIARNNLIGADPLNTASAISETEAQIELMYTLTARLSRLKLTDYL